LLGYQATSHESIRQEVLKIQPKEIEPEESIPEKEKDILLLEVDGLNVHFEGTIMFKDGSKTLHIYDNPFRSMQMISYLERKVTDSCGNSTSPKTPQSGFLEVAEAVPAESASPFVEDNGRIKYSIVIQRT